MKYLEEVKQETSDNLVPVMKTTKPLAIVNNTENHKVNNVVMSTFEMKVKFM